MKKLLILGLTAALIGPAKSQLATDVRYDLAVNYLNTHRETLRSEWIKLFKGKNRKIVKQRIGKDFVFKVSPVICFLPILVFNDINRIDSITRHTLEEIKEPTVYGARGFESYKSEYLLKNITDTITTVPVGTFIVSFSKPVNNYLIAEILGNPKRLATCGQKVLGRTMWLLFTFADNGSLDMVYYSYLDH